MKKTLTLFLYCFLTLFSTYGLARADYVIVYLKDGSKIPGNIIDSNKEEITIVTSFKTLTFQRVDIDRFDREGKKNPSTALILAIFPGGGQWYNGDYLKGIGVFASAYAGFGISLAWIASGDLFEPGMEPMEQWGGIGLAIAGIGIYTWSFFDAKKTSERTNKGRGYTILTRDPALLNFAKGHLDSAFPKVQVVSTNSRGIQMTTQIIRISFN
jgi:hypothetical protein